MKLSLTYLLPFVLAAVVRANPAPAVDAEQTTPVPGQVDARNYSYVNCRSCPHSNCEVVRTFKNGAKITIDCITDRNTETVQGSSYWDKLHSGCYMSDYYVKYLGSYPDTCPP